MASRPDDPSADDAPQNLAGQAPAADTNRDAPGKRVQEISRFPRTLETALNFLRRAARQLKLGDYQVWLQAKKRTAELEKQVLIEYYNKAVFYGFSEGVIESLKEEIKCMTLKTLT